MAPASTGIWTRVLIAARLLPRWLAVTIFMVFQVGADLIPPAARAGGVLGVADQSALTGFWVTDDGNWVVQIKPCSGGFCGQLVGLKVARKTPRIDFHNPDPAKRDRPLCGLILMGGFTPSIDIAQDWVGGWVYNPQNGKTYSGKMWLDGPDTLKVRGYVLIPLFGRVETLTRETGRINRCVR